MKLVEDTQIHFQIHTELTGIWPKFHNCTRTMHRGSTWEGTGRLCKMVGLWEQHVEVKQDNFEKGVVQNAVQIESSLLGSGNLSSICVKPWNYSKPWKHTNCKEACVWSTVRLWDASTGNQCSVLEGHSNPAVLAKTSNPSSTTFIKQVWQRRNNRHLPVNLRIGLPIQRYKKNSNTNSISWSNYLLCACCIDACITLNYGMYICIALSFKLELHHSLINVT